MHKTLVIAHRGASAYAPENTLSSFRKAILLDADGIELDVHLSRDNHLIVCHDEKVDRTTNGIGYIKDMTLKEIKKLDAGSWFNKSYCNEKIPTLNEVLDLVSGKDIIINIELKLGPLLYKNIEQKVVESIRKHGLENRTIISSFYHKSLLNVKKINPNLKTGMLYVSGLVKPWEYAKKIKADAIHPLYYNITPSLVKTCLTNGIKTTPFTIDNLEDTSKMIQSGVYAIITNYPDKALDIINCKL